MSRGAEKAFKHGFLSLVVEIGLEQDGMSKRSAAFRVTSNALAGSASCEIWSHWRRAERGHNVIYGDSG